MSTPKRMSLSSLKAMLASEKADALAAMCAAQLAGRAGAREGLLPRRHGPGHAGAGRPLARGVDRRRRHHRRPDAVADGYLLRAPTKSCASSRSAPRTRPRRSRRRDYVNHVFMQQNPGFMVMYSFIKDALLSKVGIVKVWWDEREEEERETYLDLSDDAFALLAQAVWSPPNGALEIIAHTEKTDARDRRSMHPRRHAAQTRRFAHGQGRGRAAGRIRHRARRAQLRDCNYCFHESSPRARAR